MPAPGRRWSVRVTIEFHSPCWLASSSRRRRVLLALALVLLLTLWPLAALASDVFGDVPNTLPQHDAINRVYAAGIMRACTATTPPNFCPNEPVLRVQQASQWDRALGLNGTVAPGTFVARAASADALQGYSASALSRGARSAASAVIVPSAEGTVNSVAITAPATGFVLVTAAIEAVGPEACPCQLFYAIRDNVSGLYNGFSQGLLVQWGWFDSSSVSWLFSVEAGARSFDLRAYVDYPASTTATSYSWMTALFVPFGATGSPTGISSPDAVEDARERLANPTSP